jgi:DivIVA protein
VQEESSSPRARFSKQPRASSALEELRKESEELKLQESNEELRSTLTRLEEELAGHRERESLLGETLLAARKAAKELRERAEADASAMRRTPTLCARRRKGRRKRP